MLVLRVNSFVEEGEIHLLKKVKFVKKQNFFYV